MAWRTVTPGAVACAALAFGLQMGWGPRYPVFRDEFYYLACADHLAWGYVDHPPLSIAVLAAWRALFGDSIVALRVLPSLAAGAVVLLTSGLAGALGGGAFARTLAAAAVLAAPTVFGITGFYSMNAFDLVFWLLAAHLLARIGEAPEDGRRRGWPLLGVVLGLGLLNKVSVLALGAGVGAALVLTPLRSQLRTRGPWIAAAIALVLFAPHVAWQIANDWPTAEFVRNAARHKNVALGPAGFALAQVRDFGPPNVLLWLPGLAWLAFGAGGRFRALAVVFGVAFLAFMNGKAYYLAPALPIPLAAGAVAAERWFERASRGAVLRPAAIALLLIFAAIPLPIVVPLLSPPRLASYMRALGVVPEPAERSALGVLPQHFADRFGWEELAGITARAWHSLTPAEQARAIIVTSNYGEAGAIDYHRRALGLPRAASQHNTYFLWGPGNPDADIVVTVGIDPADLREVFADVRPVAALAEPLAMPYEREHPVAICRGAKVPLREAWVRGKHFI
jgi:4-amino-4-deoxy-L-arabinose transferase-like glycosyltransferase